MKFTRTQAIMAIASACHAANKAYCESIGDFSQSIWQQAGSEIQASAANGVEFVLANPDLTPEQSHENWLAFKKETGWAYGEVKDAERKRHPCMVPYDELPITHKVKDTLFKSVVKSLIPAYPVLADADLPETNEDEDVALWKAAKVMVAEMGYEIDPGHDYGDSLPDAIKLREALNSEGELQAGADLMTGMGFETAADDEDLPDAIAAFEAALTNVES